MTSIYILFLVAPLVSNLGTYPSLEECQKVANAIAIARHQGIEADAKMFLDTRLICVKSKLTS